MFYKDHTNFMKNGNIFFYYQGLPSLPSITRVISEIFKDILKEFFKEAENYLKSKFLLLNN